MEKEESGKKTESSESTVNIVSGRKSEGSLGAMASLICSCAERAAVRGSVPVSRAELTASTISGVSTGWPLSSMVLVSVSKTQD